MKLVVLGPPGAGKGTQAAKLSGELSLPRIATGDMLRLEVSSGTELGKEAEGYMRRGLLVPDEIIIEMVRERVSHDDCKGGFILDGFPRNMAQAKTLEALGPMDLVIYLDAGEEEVVERLVGRRACRECQAVYHLRFSPPKADGRCDLCGGRLHQREDDREGVVRERFRTYRERTQPLVQYYQAKSILEKVEGLGTIEEISRSIRETLESRGLI